MKLNEAKNYKAYLNFELNSERHGRGVRAKLAERLGVQPSFISSVLSGQQEFSAEHGAQIAQFLGLDTEETFFLILLINRDRAGSQLLRDQYDRELELHRKKSNEIKSRVKKSMHELSQSEFITYFASWINIAVHMASRISRLNNPRRIAEALGIKPAQAKESLDFLERVGFIEQSGARITHTKQRLHYSDDPGILKLHHQNWRQAAVRSLDEKAPANLHYSLVMSIDHKRFEMIRKILLETVERVDPLIKEAKDEEVYAFCFDLFKVTEITDSG